MVVALVATASQWQGTQAASTSQVGNPANVLATTALYAPSDLSAVASGHDVELGWSAGRNGSGYAVQGAANGASNNCQLADFSSVGSSVGTSYTDAGRSSPQGTFFCYRVATTYGTAWSSRRSNPRAAVRIGFVATSATISNGTLAGALDPGDRIVLTFNQPVDPASGPGPTDTICSTTLGRIQLGSTTTNGSCSADETLTVGALTGGTIDNAARWEATYTWGNARRRLTIVVGSRVGGAPAPAATGAWTFTPTSTADKLSSATGGFHICDTNSGGGICLPAATGDF